MTKIFIFTNFVRQQALLSIDSGSHIAMLQSAPVNDEGLSIKETATFHNLHEQTFKQ